MSLHVCINKDEQNTMQDDKMNMEMTQYNTSICTRYAQTSSFYRFVISVQKLLHRL